MYQMKLCEYYSPIVPGFVYKFCSGRFGWDEELNKTTSFEISDYGLSTGDRLSCLENNLFQQIDFFFYSAYLVTYAVTTFISCPETGQ